MVAPVAAVWLAAPRCELEVAQGGLRAFVDGPNRTYGVLDPRTGWRFSGGVVGAVSATGRASGKDASGAYVELRLAWSSAACGRVLDRIRLYRGRRQALFEQTYLDGVAGPGARFPDFSEFPTGLHAWSFQDRPFAPPVAKLVETSTPWLLFDGLARSVILSPAGHFIVASMSGDGRRELACGLEPRLRRVPKGFAQSCLLSVSDGIGSNFDAWGAALRALYHRPSASRRPLAPGPARRDPLLGKYSYWTDNGATYYYAEAPRLGYAGTLLAAKRSLDASNPPIGAMQLDSWWYPKSRLDPAGRMGGPVKNPKLPAQPWNRYGGALAYRASRDLFPDGLAAFQRALGLPLAVHTRWIDPGSSYRRKYAVSGVAPVDPAYWRDLAASLRRDGVTTLEQDWLSEIYRNSPAMATDAAAGDAFAGGMAAACAAEGMTLQYCMATPRFFLQGVEYPNLTTIRTSDDRFVPARRRDFLFTSQLADALGIAPFTDVFMSGERDSLLIAVLSGGPVGIGDPIGAEDRAALRQVLRPDGVPMRPDRPLRPTDATYLDEATTRSKPFVAATYVDRGGVRTAYVLLLGRKGSGGPGRSAVASLRPADFGIPGEAYASGDARGWVRAGGSLTMRVAAGATRFVELSSLLPSGVALVGDAALRPAMSAARVVPVRSSASGATVRIRFAPGERGPVRFEAAGRGTLAASALVGRARVVSGYVPGRPQTVEVRPGSGGFAAFRLRAGALSDRRRRAARRRRPRP